MNHIFKRPHTVKTLSPIISAVALSLLLVACAEPDPIVIDVSGLNLNPTQAELEAIFGGESDTPEPTPVDEPDDEPAPLTYTTGPQSLAEFTDSDLSGASFAKDTIDGQFYTRSNNTALLSGAVFGTGEVLNSDIRRIIPYTLNRLVDGIELEAVYLLKGNNNNILDSDLAVGIVRNTSTKTRCYISASGITVLDRQGNPSTDYIADIAGVIGASGTDSAWRDIPNSNRCLGVGDYGYFRASLDTTDLDGVGGISIKGIDYLDTDFVITTPVMVPVTYTPTDNGVAVTVINQSTLRLKLVGINSVFLDEQGLPLGLNRWNPSPAETLAPGQEMVFNVDVEFRGSVSSIRFVLDLNEGDRE